MPTSNLITSSLGNLQIQSGSGTPNHTANAGTVYYDNNTNMLWESIYGTGNSWMPLTPSIYGELDIDTNTTLSTPSGVNTFFSLSGLTWVNNNNNLKGFTVNNNKLVLNNGLDGVYRVIGNLGVLYNATVNDYKIGVSINGQVPALSAQSSTGTNTVKTAGHGTVIIDTYLSGGTSVELTVAPTISGTGTFRVRDANLVIYRLF
jgi:hypothetical protein